MQFIKQRQNDPQYLKSVIVQRDIIIEEEKRKLEELAKQHSKLKTQYQEIQRQKAHKQQSFTKEMHNLNMAIKEYESQIEMLKHEKSQQQFMLNNSKIKLQEFEREHKNQMEKLTIQFQSHRDLLNIKVMSLEKNLGELKKYYRVQQQIVDDKKKIIEDSNRDLRGFSNQKQERLLIIQNQQYKNQIEYQSKNLTIQLQKNEKLLEEIKALKIQVQLHKQIQNDLVKRSSLAQTLIKKLYKEIQEIKKGHMDSQISQSQHTTSRQDLSLRQSTLQAIKEKQDQINKLKFQLANSKNYGHYLQNTQKVYSKKYQTLASLLSEYLQNLVYYKQSSSEGESQGVGSNQMSLNINQLRVKDVRQWRFEEMEAIVHCLLTQVKPFLSKNSLISFPEIKNVNISFVEDHPKEMISLPKIAENYEKTYEKEAKKGQNRFKDIPIDISTKILRSNLRQWGSKIKYGNMPVVKKMKSRSIAEQNQKSFL